MQPSGSYSHEATRDALVDGRSYAYIFTYTAADPVNFNGQVATSTLTIDVIGSPTADQTQPSVVIGGASYDTLTGGTAGDRIVGTAGGDRLVAGAGAMCSPSLPSRIRLRPIPKRSSASGKVSTRSICRDCPMRTGRLR